MPKRKLKTSDKCEENCSKIVKLSEAKKLVELAKKQTDPLSPFPDLQRFENESMCLTVECKRCVDMDAHTLKWAFLLLRKNMQLLYKKSEWGWHPTFKKREMMSEDARYLVAREQESKKPVAFSHFRFDIDYGYPVLYCYELQLEKSCRRMGLGKFMLQILEKLCYSSKMDKVVLTVLKHNPGSVLFFKSQNYNIDESSPKTDCSYEILSKQVSDIVS